MAKVGLSLGSPLNTMDVNPIGNPYDPTPSSGLSSLNNNFLHIDEKKLITLNIKGSALVRITKLQDLNMKKVKIKEELLEYRLVCS